MNFRIAIIEDEPEQSAALRQYLERYEQENDFHFSVTEFSNAVLFLENYKAEYHVVFMDIRMPHLNGMTAAHRLRELDTKVGLIFITSLSQYAISGYEVDALDYILKPVKYYDFALKFSHALDRIDKEEEPTIVVPTDSGMVRLTVAGIRYIESRGRFAVYHTSDGREYSQYATMASLEKLLAPHGFSRCNSCYLVNLRYVVNIKGYTAFLDEGTLKISQPRKKAFQKDFINYWDNFRP